jgi:hypothetical protein
MTPGAQAHAGSTGHTGSACGAFIFGGCTALADRPQGADAAAGAEQTGTGAHPHDILVTYETSNNKLCWCS